MPIAQRLQPSSSLEILPPEGKNYLLSLTLSKVNLNEQLFQELCYAIYFIMLLESALDENRWMRGRSKLDSKEESCDCVTTFLSKCFISK